jgi:hypothetical protein
MRMAVDDGRYRIAIQGLFQAAAPQERENLGRFIGVWGYHDARIKPLGPMSPEEVAHWTAAIAVTKT